MSRGFVKEDDLEHAGTDLPERPISANPNYVTPQGLKQLQELAVELDTLRSSLVSRKDDAMAQQALAKTDRDLRYLSARLEQAILVDPAQQPKDTVLFGASVSVEDEEGQTMQFTIVGEDEADASQQKVSYVSPIARALIGRKVGDVVIWQRPIGNLTLEITTINY